MKLRVRLEREVDKIEGGKEVDHKSKNGVRLWEGQDHGGKERVGVIRIDSPSSFGPIHVVTSVVVDLNPIKIERTKLWCWLKSGRNNLLHAVRYASVISVEKREKSEGQTLQLGLRDIELVFLESGNARTYYKFL